MSDAMIPSSPTLPAEPKKKSLKGNVELQEEAKAMYFNGISPVEICEHLNVDIDELGYLVFGKDGTGESSRCWFAVKSKRLANGTLSTVTNYALIKPYLIKKTEKKMLDKVNEALETVDAEEMGVSGIKDMVTSMEKIDKIGRLEEGKATEHVHQTRQTFSLRDIVAKAKVVDDDIEDAEIIGEEDE
jgi:hypothetical protein